MLEQLTVRRLSYGYRETHTVLSDVSLSVYAGEVLGLLGPNGTGKTTLIKCIAQLLRPMSGEILSAGRSLTSMRPQDIAKEVAYVPQHSHANVDMTVMQAVLMGRLPFAGYRYTAKDEQIAADVIRHMGLETFAFRHIGEMSGGERQRVYIARALAQEVPIILLDEPTSSLDLYHRLFLLRLIRKIAVEKNIAILLTIHDLNLASLFCDTLLMLKDARVYAYGKAQDVLTEESIHAIYGVKTCVTVEDGYKHIRLLP